MICLFIASFQGTVEHDWETSFQPPSNSVQMSSWEANYSTLHKAVESQKSDVP